MTSPVPERDPAAVRRGRIKLAWLAALFALPVAASWLIWSFELVPGVRANYGTLLPPTKIALPADPALKGKWILVQFAGGACDAACERKLYFMRQVRRAQGREMDRVARLWLVTDAARIRPEVHAAIEGTVVLPAAGRSDFPADASPEDHVYLVDPLGNLMMRFPRDPEPTKVINDLRRLLRASSFG